jgi:hypothetical protein
MRSTTACRRRDVLVDSEKIVRIELGFNLLKARTIVSVGGFNADGGFVHHEIHIRSGGGVGAQRLPVIFGPAGDFAGVGGGGIDADDRLRCTAPLIGYRCIIQRLLGLGAGVRTSCTSRSWCVSFLISSSTSSQYRCFSASDGIATGETNRKPIHKYPASMN